MHPASQIHCIACFGQHWRLGCKIEDQHKQRIQQRVDYAKTAETLRKFMQEDGADGCKAESDESKDQTLQDGHKYSALLIGL